MIIKKYKNRKLYHKRFYMRLKDFAREYTNQCRVIDHDSGEDITFRTLTAALDNVNDPGLQQKLARAILDYLGV